MKEINNRHIWIEAEEWAEDEWNIEDDNLDVIVTFSDRSKWIASFLPTKTYRHCERKMQGQVNV